MWTPRGGWPTGADAVTLEIEQIGVDALREVARIAPLRPGVEPIRIIQDKTLQKTWLAENGFPVGPFRVVRSEAELQRGCAPRWAATCFLKIGRGGYDGRGQARIGLDAPATAAVHCSSMEGNWRAARSRRAGARSRLRDQRDGRAQSRRAKCAVIPPRAIIMKIRFWRGACCRPACPPELESRAEALAAAIIAKLGIEGLLCVEIFVTRAGRVAGQRACAAAAQQLSPERARLRDQPVRAACARGVQSAAGLDGR